MNHFLVFRPEVTKGFGRGAVGVLQMRPDGSTKRVASIPPNITSNATRATIVPFPATLSKFASWHLPPAAVLDLVTRRPWLTHYERAARDDADGCGADAECKQAPCHTPMVFSFTDDVFFDGRLDVAPPVRLLAGGTLTPLTGGVIPHGAVVARLSFSGADFWRHAKSVPPDTLVRMWREAPKWTRLPPPQMPAHRCF